MVKVDLPFGNLWFCLHHYNKNAEALTELAAGTIVGVAGTIKSQSVAAGTGSVASTATITVTPYATAS